jgi:hypothetical protein
VDPLVDIHLPAQACQRGSHANDGAIIAKSDFRRVCAVACRENYQQKTCETELEWYGYQPCTAIFIAVNII